MIYAYMNININDLWTSYIGRNNNELLWKCYNCMNNNINDLWTSYIGWNNNEPIYTGLMWML